MARSRFLQVPGRRRRAPRSRGQAMLEFALVLPVLLMIVLMALDFGRVFFGWVGLQNVARVGANVAALNPFAWGSPGNATAQARYLVQIQAEAAALNCTLPSPLPTPAFPSGQMVGSGAEVHLTCAFPLLTPFVSLILGGTVTIAADAVFPIRGGIPEVVPTPTPTPTVSPTASPTPSASATPTPQLCDVPSFIGTKKNNAQATWNAAGFTTTIVFLSGNGNYTIRTQVPAVGGQPVGCTTTVMQVGP